MKKEEKIERSLGGQILYRVDSGFKIRRKTGVDGERVKTDPAFSRTLENAAEFSEATAAGKLLREALSMSLSNTKDRYMHIRLATAMYSVLKEDHYHHRGARQVANGNLELLEDFQFNKGCSFGNTVRVPYTAVIDEVKGDARVSFPAFVPAHAIHYPPAATHYILHMSVAAVDFENGYYDADAFATAPLPVTSEKMGEMELVLKLAPGDLPMFVALGIYFVDVTNNRQSVLRNMSFNAGGLVKVCV